MGVERKTVKEQEENIRGCVLAGYRGGKRIADELCLQFMEWTDIEDETTIPQKEIPD